MRYLFIPAMLLSLCWAAEELRVVAENFDADEQKGISTFTGNVKIEKGNDELNASKVVIHVDKNRKPSKYIAEGNVSFYIRTENNDTYKGRAQKAVFVPAEKLYRFYTDVHLRQINRHKEINGDEVVLDALKGRAIAKGAEKKPVIMTFQLEDKNETK